MPSVGVLFEKLLQHHAQVQNKRFKAENNSYKLLFWINRTIKKKKNTTRQVTHRAAENTNL